MECFTRLTAKNQNFEQLCEKITLKQKKTGFQISYPLYKQDKVYQSGMQQLLIDFENKQKLEVEFDYDTDAEQIIHSRNMLLDDLQ